MKVCQMVSSVIKSEICFDHLPARTSSVLVAEVGEPPDVAETNRDGDAGEEEVQLVPKRPSLRIIFLTMKKNALSSQNVIQNVTLGGEGDHLYSVFRRGVDPQLDILRLHLSLPRLRMDMFTSTPTISIVSSICTLNSMGSSSESSSNSAVSTISLSGFLGTAVRSLRSACRVLPFTATLPAPGWCKQLARSTHQF